MIQGFKILTASDVHDKIIDYRNKGAVRGVYLGFPLLHEIYTMSLPGVTDWTGFPQSGKSEFVLEMLLNTSEFYGWKHLIYVPDVGEMEEIISLLMHKRTGKTFDKRYINSNYIEEKDIELNLDWIMHHFRILYKEDLSAKITPYQFWDIAASLSQSIEGGIQTATIDSWKDTKHGVGPDGSTFPRDDKFLEDVLSYRNAIAEKYKIHIHTIIHPRSGTEKDKDGNRKPPKPDELKGGPEWWNNGKTMITVHRPDGKFNEVDIIVTKAKPKSVAKQGKVTMYFDAKLNRFYWEDTQGKHYANEKYIKPSALLSESNEDDDDDLPF